MTQRSQGFTLIEISMVLVIISFLIAGITVASSLIRNAEMQNLNGEMQAHIAAIKAFQDKYYALPGDFIASSIGFSGGFDGNGNGTVTGDEQFYAWTHLAAAGLVDGSYTGADVSGGGTYDRSPGVNIPASQLSGAGWGFVYVPNTTADLLYVSGDINPNHVLWLGGRSTNGADNTQTPVLSSEEADLLDRKYDDGLPGTGKAVAQVNASGTACTDSISAYKLSVSGKICSLVFKTGF